MKKSENNQSPYTFVELLPILTAFSNVIQLCDRALEDDRLAGLDEDIAGTIQTIRHGVKSFITLSSSAAIID